MNNALYIEEKGPGKYAVETEHSSVALHIASTQEDAINWAKRNHPTRPLHVARVRNTNKGNPDHWRKI